jgi:hypothetical protein
MKIFKISPFLLFLLINILSGPLVILSYILGIGSNDINILWGGVPKELRGVYSLSMVLGAISFFIFSIYILKNLRIKGYLIAYSSYINLFYLLILIPSALWIPLVSNMVMSPSDITWIGIRSVLIIVALGSIGLLLLLIKTSPKIKSRLYYLSIIALIWFIFHTGILDAIVWPSLWNYS